MSTPIKVVSIKISGLPNTGKTTILKEIHDILKEKGFSIHLTNEEDIRDIKNMQEINISQEELLNTVKDKITINLSTSEDKRNWYFKPSELAIKAHGTVQEDGAVKDLQILSVDLVNQSSN